MRSIILLTLTSFFVGPLSAQYAEMGISAGYGRLGDGNLGRVSGFGRLDEYRLKSGVRIGARMSFDWRAYFAHELAYAWQRSQLNVRTEDAIAGRTTEGDVGSSSIHNYYYNFVAHATRRDTFVRPFVTAGVGMSSFTPPGYGATSSGQTKFGYNYGAGVKVLLTDRYGFRFDVRDHVTSKPFFDNLPGRLHNLETSGTFLFLFR